MRNRLTRDELQPVAGGGLLDRRIFLKHGLQLGAASMLTANILSVAAKEQAADSALTAPDWMRKPGLPFSNYGKPSSHEKKSFAGFLPTKSCPVTACHGRRCTSWRAS